MVSGGIASAKKLPEVDLFRFAPRVNVPVLMLNGVDVDPICEHRPNRVV
jgi:cephalosporin-C deacetylase-like acetyl esterase